MGILGTGGDGAKDWEKLAEVSPSAGDDYVEFTGLDINTDGYYILLFYSKCDSWDREISVLFNGNNTGTDYYTQTLEADDTTLTSARSNNPDMATIGASDGVSGRILITLDANSDARAMAEFSDEQDRYVILYWAVVVLRYEANITSIKIDFPNMEGGLFTLFRPK